MGLFHFGSSCSDDSHLKNVTREIVHRHHKPEIVKKIDGNPNPINFRILRYEKAGRFVVVLVRYPDCSNYEGHKILVFENVSLGIIKNLKAMDPHFCNSDAHHSPVARFVPTDKGWRYALLFCRNA